jgi:hypothetical protein
MRFTLKTIRPIRVLLAFFACAFLMLSNAYPAMAFGFGGAKSSPTEGEVNLTDIDRKSEQVLEQGPQSPDEIRNQAPGSGGINEIQGTADKDKMKTPENSKGTTFEEQVEKALDKATN